MKHAQMHELCRRLVFLSALTLLVALPQIAFADLLTAVDLCDVTVEDRFWSPRIETNRTVTIPYCFEMCERTGRIDNFAKAARLMQGDFEGIYFNDSDVYKLIEAAAYSLVNRPDPNLEQYVDGLIEKIAAAQWEDGYLYTFYSVPNRQPEKRWTNLKDMHELYCAGHLFEAAVAYNRATGKTKLLDVAIKLADHINFAFGPYANHNVPGHPEIEIGLIKLFRLTGNDKYFKLAKFFVDQRGYAHNRPLYGTYCQDHIPVIKQREAVGHAVRAAYLYSAMADIAAHNDDRRYITALEQIWQDVVSKKMYLAGGIGSTHEGEAFGREYELPNKTAYCETCAAIANAMWNHRMFLLSGDAEYLDVLERIIYNGLLSGVSLSGNRFFYPNPLLSDGEYGFNKGLATRRAWFSCACCPPNIARFLASLGGYIYARDKDAIYVNLFVVGTATIQMGENTVRITQRTDYPWDGDIEITIEPEYRDQFTVFVRIPGWLRDRPVPSHLYRYKNRLATGMKMKVDEYSVGLQTRRGFARIQREWMKGDIIRIHLPMPIRRVLAHECVAENGGRVALERGPIVYCAEAVDNHGGALNIVLQEESELEAEFREDLLGAVVVLTGNAYGLYVGPDGWGVVLKKQDFTAVPYFAWSNRSVGEMAVWLAEKPDIAVPSGR